MIKKILSVLLVLTLSLGLSVPALAVEYPDLSGHWAKPYMDDLSSRGYLTGYTDGTMKPDRNISAGETLVLLSRLYKLSDLENTLITEDYEATVKSAASSAPEWEYPYLKVCLAAGIITKDELSASDLTADIQKEQLSVYLVRALQLTKQAEDLSGTTLGFADAETISEDCVGSVSKLLELGIVKGDENNNFSPKSGVTRAVAATMVSRSLDYLKNGNISLSISEYAGLTRYTGVLSAVNASVLSLLGTDGLPREYAVGSDARISINGVSKALSATYVGCYAEVTERQGAAKRVSVTSSSDVSGVHGILTGISTSLGQHTATSKQVGDGSFKSYVIPSGVTVTLNGAESSVSALKKDMFVSLQKTSESITRVLAATGGDEDLKGTISSITLGTTVVLKVASAEGTVYRFDMPIKNLPKIVRGSTTITVDRLKAGNSVTVSMSDYAVTGITVAGSSSSVTGTIVSTSSDASGTVWVLDVDGTRTSYQLDSAASAYNGSVEISLSSISVGDKVTVAVYDNTITEIALISGANSSTKLSGSVLIVSSNDKLITILTTEGKLAYISTGSATIIVASTGRSIYLSNLTAESSLTAYGEYSNGKFAATSIIVEYLAG